MAHVAKYKRPAIGHLTQHFERGKDENGNYLRFGNQEIDPALTPANYNLAPDRNQAEFIRLRCGEIQCSKRKDVNIFCSWIVTAPKSLHPDNFPKFFEESYRFLSDRYGGEKNVVSSFVHLDESTPHMHFAFIPVAIDKKKKIEKVSAKEVLTKSDLQKFHTDLDRHMERVFGRDIGILNEATKEGNRSVEELKRDTATEIMQNAREQSAQIVQDSHAEAARIVSKGQARVESLQADENALQGKIDAIQGKLPGLELTAEKINKLQPQISRPIFGSEDDETVKFPKKSFDNLKKTALKEKAARIKAEGEIESLKSKVKSLEHTVSVERARELEGKISVLEREKNSLEEQIKEKDFSIRSLRVHLDNSKRETTKLEEKISRVRGVLTPSALNEFEKAFKTPTQRGRSIAR